MESWFESRLPSQPYFISLSLVDLPVLPLYNEVTVRKRLSCAEQEAIKNRLIDLVAKSERDIVKIRTRRGI